MKTAATAWLPVAKTVDVRWMALAVTLGVVGVHLLRRLPDPLWLVPLAAVLLIPGRGRIYGGCLALGVMSAVLVAQAYLDQRWPADRHGERLWVEGHIASLPEQSDAVFSGDGGQYTWRFTLQPMDAGLPAKIRVSWYGTDAQLRAGQCWRLLLRMRTPHGALNPKGFDYEAWLYRAGFGATASVREARRCPGADRTGVTTVRQAIRDRLDQWMPQGKAAALMAALTVGDGSGFSDEDWSVFRRTGTTHLVVISGFNVAIVSGFFYFLIRCLWAAIPGAALRWPAQKAGLLGSAGAAIIYALLAGWDSPVQRAALMLVALLLAALLDQKTRPSRVLALVWMLMLLLDPPSVLSPGLWLSFAAVGAIFYVSTARFANQAAWRQLIYLQLILSLLLAPLTMLFFQGASLLGPAVNLIAVPVMTLVTPLVVLSVVLGWLWPVVGLPMVEFSGWILELLHSGLHVMAAFDLAAWRGFAPSNAAIAMALFGAVLLFAPRGWPMRALAVICVAPLLMQPTRPPENGLEVMALDVGQGLAVVVRTNNHALLYDAGPAFAGGFDAGESVVAPNLLGMGIRELDVLMLSHGDRDHAGGVGAVRKRISIQREIGTDESRPCRAGQQWQWDGVSFSVLHPDDQNWSDNNRSCVLRVDGAFSALLAGDIEKAAERHLLQEDPASLRAELLIAPHHGSRTSSTEAFVRAVKPQQVLFGAAWRSHFGHPVAAVQARYLELGAQTHTTGVHGAVRFWRDASGALRAERFRPKAARFWNAPALW